MKMDLERFPKSETAKKLMEYVTAGWYETAYMDGPGGGCCHGSGTEGL